MTGDRPLQSIPDDGVHRRPDDWNVLAARGIAASLRPSMYSDEEFRQFAIQEAHAREVRELRDEEAAISRAVQRQEWVL